MSPRITAIVPTYNEAKRLPTVLKVLTTFPRFHEVIVVDDGSTDATATVVQSFPVRYLRHSPNQGKGYAMDQGVQAAAGDIIFFCDADVRGLTHEIITATVTPVTTSRVEMFIAMRNRKIYFLHFVLNIIPLLGGERAITKRLWQKIPAYYKQRFRIEAALNFFATHEGRGFSYQVFPGLSQTIKEKKLGFWPGQLARWRMIRDVIAAELHVRQHYVREYLVKTAKT
ncbi:MAG: glycosyltransferase family 2 protein [Candidatus Andersenbacteria bacterium]